MYFAHIFAGDRFVYNSQKCYNPNGYLTVDEQLFPTKVRCRFIQFMRSKPDKFGIKFWVLVDVKSKYICNAFPYLGKDEEHPMNQTLGEYIVKKVGGTIFTKRLQCDNGQYVHIKTTG